MKIRKVLISIIIFMFAMLLYANKGVFAASSVYFRPEFLRKPINGHQYGYTYGARGGLSNKKIVWKIISTDSNGNILPDSYDKTIYCLRAGYGFYRNDSSATEQQIYNNTISLLESSNKDKIIKILFDTTNPRQYYSNYNSILWILNNAYTPEKGENYKNALLDKVKEARPDIDWTSYDLTDDDIDVVQQIAIWQFTYESGDIEYKIADNIGDNYLGELQITSNNDTKGISEYDSNNGTNRLYQTKALYQYLITQAENAKDTEQIPTTETETGKLITITANTENPIEDGKIGPITLTKNNSNIDTYITELTITDNKNQSITNYTLYTKNDSGEFEEVENNSENLREIIEQGKQIYIGLEDSIDITSITITVSSEYTKNKMDLWIRENSSNNIYQPLVEVGYEEVKDEDSITIELETPEIDLALRKSITKIGDQDITNRKPNQDTTNLYPNGTGNTTAEYIHPKYDLPVYDGDIIEYTLTIFNEGQVDAGASEIKDYLPRGINFIELVGENSDRYTTTVEEDDENEMTIVTITPKNRDDIVLDKYEGAEKTDYTTITLRCRVDARGLGSNPRLVNIAEITKYYDGTDEINTDRDSGTTPDRLFPDEDKNNSYKDDVGNEDNVPGHEDDDDFEPVILKEVDLALRKSITRIGTQTPDPDRLPDPDTSQLIPNGTETTAEYNHPKDDLTVKVGDEIEYTLTIFNEGAVNGYAKEIKDYLPVGIEFVSIDDTENYTIEATEQSDGTTELILTRKEGLTKEYLEAFETEDGEARTEGLDSETVTFTCRVTSEAKGRLVNIAEITKYHNSRIDEDVDVDRDSETENFRFPSDISGYNENRTEDYVPGQQDDDDFEPVILDDRYMDLALRKFITNVNGDEVDPSREPVFTTNIDETTNSYIYEHLKDPVLVKNGDIVIYTLRIYNEGEIDGYAEIVEDDLPEGIEFLPTNTINTEYRWGMYDENDEETSNVEEAVTIKTDYLSQAQGEARQEDEESENPNLLHAFDPDTMDEPDYRDIQIAFRVSAENTYDGIITNYAQIEKQVDENGEEVPDIDSTPGNLDGEPTEDDEDVEHIKLEYFDLSLRKWVNQVIVIQDGKQVVTNTGNKAEDDPEDVAKVELPSNDLDSIVVKFDYKIKVTNEGKIAGTVDEITDYIPEGLQFVQADNPRWTQVEEQIVSTRYAGDTPLSDIVLEPGDTVTVDIVLTWINGEDNLGLKTNTAEISADSDDDIDSTPGNRVDGEDDIDIAQVMLSIVTGSAQTYIGLATGILAIIGTGLILIKKYVI